MWQLIDIQSGGLKKKKKIHSNSTKTIREVSCWCRFKNNDIQWAGKLFFLFMSALMQPGNVQLYCHSSEISTWLWQLFPLQATLIRLKQARRHMHDEDSLEDIILYIWLGVSCEECCPAHKLAENFRKWAHSPVRLIMRLTDYILN